MEFEKKLQELRKQKNITQEQLAEELYVSRTAVSKWESGRGYPSIDSLKSIASYFSISIDDLLSSREVVKIAEEDKHKKTKLLLDLIFGLVDISLVIFFFLPFFGYVNNGEIIETSLIYLQGYRYINIPYYILTSSIVVIGILFLTLQTLNLKFWNKFKYIISISVSTVLAVFLEMSMQPYAGVYLIIMLVIKFIVLLKSK